MQQRERFGFHVAAAGLAANLALFAGKFAMGRAAGSAAVVADSLNNLADCGVALCIALSFLLSGRRASAAYPFGLGRVEYLTGLLAALLVAGSGMVAGRLGVERLAGTAPPAMNPLIAVGVTATIMAKLLMGGLYKVANVRLDSPAVDALVVDSLGDAVLSALTLAPFMTQGLVSPSLPVDALVGVVIALMVVATGGRLAWRSMRKLVGVRCAGLELRLTRLLLGMDHVSGVHGVLVHDYGPASAYASAHVELASTLDLPSVHDTVERATQAAREQLGVDLTLHADPAQPRRKPHPAGRTA